MPAEPGVDEIDSPIDHNGHHAVLKVSCLGGPRFRVVHDGTRVLAVVDGGTNDITKTGPQNQMFVAGNMTAVENRVKQLGLIPLPPQP